MKAIPQIAVGIFNTRFKIWLNEEGKIAVTDEAPPIAPNLNEKVGVSKDPLPSASAFSPFFPLALTAY